MNLFKKNTGFIEQLFSAYRELIYMEKEINAALKDHKELKAVDVARREQILNLVAGKLINALYDQVKKDLIEEVME